MFAPLDNTEKLKLVASNQIANTKVYLYDTNTVNLDELKDYDPRVNYSLSEFSNSCEEKVQVIDLDNKEMGKGLFASADIKMKEYLFYVGEIVNTEIEEELEEQREVLLYYADGYVIDCTYYRGDSYYINHSCDPNCKLLICFDDQTKLPYVIITPLKKLNKGEQLTMNYHWSIRDNRYTKLVPCLCGSRKCKIFLQLDFIALLSKFCRKVSSQGKRVMPEGTLKELVQEILQLPFDSTLYCDYPIMEQKIQNLLTTANLEHGKKCHLKEKVVKQYRKKRIAKQ